MKPLEDPTGNPRGRQLGRWSILLVILGAAVSLGPQPALPGDAVKDGPSMTAGRVRPLDLVKASVSQVLAEHTLRDVAPCPWAPHQSQCLSLLSARTA